MTWLKKSLKVLCLIYFKEISSNTGTCSIDRVFNKEHFYEKSIQKICIKR